MLHGSGMTNAYMQEGLDALKSGQVAMQMNWFAFFPGLLFGPERRRRQNRLLCQSGRARMVILPNSADRASRWWPLPTIRTMRFGYIKWFAQPAVQQKWWEIGGYSALRAVVDAPGFPKSAPFAPQFLESMAIVKDFWAEPSYAQLLLDMQKRVHDYVIADKGTAQQALDQSGQGLDQSLQGTRQGWCHGRTEARQLFPARRGLPGVGVRGDLFPPFDTLNRTFNFL